MGDLEYNEEVKNINYTYYLFEIEFYKAVNNEGFVFVLRFMLVKYDLSRSKNKKIIYVISSFITN